MYDENSFKNYIFWIKVKRAFFMLIFSILGAFIGVISSEFIVNILLFDQIFRVIIIVISTLLFFSISLLITANTGKEVQDGYWKIAVLRKLTVISKKLDNVSGNPVKITEVSKTLNQTIKDSLEEDGQLSNTIPSKVTKQKTAAKKKTIKTSKDDDML